MKRISVLRQIEPTLRKQCVQVGVLPVTTERDMAIFERYETMSRVVPIMECYNRIGREFRLSEVSVRKVINKLKQ